MKKLKHFIFSVAVLLTASLSFSQSWLHCRLDNGNQNGSQQVGDVFKETFTPQLGVYTLAGTGSYTSYPNSLSVSGGNGFLNNWVMIDNHLTNWNDWYYEIDYTVNNSSNGTYSAVFGLQSQNPAQNASMHFGFYYFSANNVTYMNILQSTGPTATGGTIGVSVGDQIRVRCEQHDSLFIAYGYNLTTGMSTSISTTYSYSLSSYIPVEPNNGKYNIVPGTNICNITAIRYGSSEYTRKLLVDGDSRTAGYFGGHTRFYNTIKTATGKQVTAFAGSSDFARASINSKRATVFQKFKPKKVLILLGTNDKSQGVSDAVIRDSLQVLVTKYASTGASVYVCNELPRDDINMTSCSSSINGLTGCVIIDSFTHFLDPNPLNPTGINPLWSDDGLHFNNAGMIEFASLVMGSGFN